MLPHRGVLFLSSKGETVKAPNKQKLLSALDANWQTEMEGVYTYQTLSDREIDPQRKSALHGLSTAEKHHADLWAGRIRDLGGAEPVYTGHSTGQADDLASRVASSP